MPTFICSLFLPYTVDFHDIPTPARGPSPTRGLLARKDSVGDLSNSVATLFPNPTPPRTPAADAEVAEFFSQDTPGAATHFLKPHVPRALVRSDAHVPEWGRNPLFNQPRSKAGPAPPDNILRYIQQAREEKQARDKPPSASTASSRPQSRGASSRRHKRNPSGRIALPTTPRSRGQSSERSKWASEWTVEAALQGNGGLANAVRAASDEEGIDGPIWVGTVGFPTDSLDDATRDEIHEKLESEYHSLAVYVNDNDFDGHYTHYCKTILWPVFHYQIPDHPKSKAYEDHSYKYYVRVNQAFADKIVSSYKRGDVIWIHDYHLLLVPCMVRKKLPDAKIGFFLHTAFPSSEVFRCLAVRKELLDGMLGANLVAFQSWEYQEHFLTTCSRLLTVEATNEGVQLDDRFVNVAAVPIGIDPKGFHQARQDESVQLYVERMRERYANKKIIVARDQLDNVRGVRQKLLAFELFLNKYPEWRENVILVQVATSTAENNELAATVSDIVTRIDSIHSTLSHNPLVFLRQDIPFAQYLALLSVADALLVTSLRDGMNLTTHEFTLAQDGHYGKKWGPIILSEFTGSATILGSQVLRINPWDYQQTADAINMALKMSEKEKKQRWSALQDIVNAQTGTTWAATLTKKLAHVCEEQYRCNTISIPRLSASALGEKYQGSRSRLFILDYEGTLANFSAPRNVQLSSPQRVLDTLNDLLSDRRNIVYVMSGNTPEELERLFSRVPGLGLIAENGCFIREAGSDDWVSFPDLARVEEWKTSVKSILQYYHERIEGSVIEEKHCSVAFNYAKADDCEGALRQAGDCANHINDACAGQKVQAIPVDKAVVIEPIEWSKGSAAKHIFRRLGQNSDRKPDFLVVAGDDRADEAIFRWANELGTDGDIAEVTTVSVGKRNTEATATLTQGTSGLLTVLRKLAKLR